MAQITSDELELAPEEKLLCALFSRAGLMWDGRKIRSHLPSEGKEVLNNVLLRYCDERTFKIMRLRFGFIPRSDSEKIARPGPDSRTLEEVGNIIGVTRERIRMIEAKTLRRLRHPDFCKELLSWWLEITGDEIHGQEGN